MKSFLILISLFFSCSSFATGDFQSEVTIVVESVNESGVYYLKTAPVEFCVGIPSYSLGTAITKPVTIKVNYGCGHGNDMIFDSQVNEATCAKIGVGETRNEDGSVNYKNLEVVMDTTGCGEKAKSKNFLKALEQAIRNTFKSHNYKIVSLTKK